MSLAWWGALIQLSGMLVGQGGTGLGLAGL